MDEEVPARKALRYAEQHYEKPQGRPKETWIHSMQKLLEETLNMTWQEAKLATQDRKVWRDLVWKAMIK